MNTTTGASLARLGVSPEIGVGGENVQTEQEEGTSTSSKLHEGISPLGNAESASSQAAQNLLTKLAASKESEVDKTEVFKDGANDTRGRMHRMYSAPDLRQFSLFDGKFNNPSLLKHLELQPVHEEAAKPGEERSGPRPIKPIDNRSVGGSANQPTKAECTHSPHGASFWKQVSKVKGLFHRDRLEKRESVGAHTEDEDNARVLSPEKHRQRLRRLSMKSDAGNLGDSVHGSYVSRTTSYEDLDASRQEGWSGISERRAKSGIKGSRKILKQSSKVLKTYITDSVSRRSQSHTSQPEHPDTQLTTPSRLSSLTDNWQREFYGLAPADRARQFLASQSEDQSSLRTSRTGSSDLGSRYGMSTGKAQKGLLLPLIHPYSRARRDMNVLIAVCLLYIAIVLPFEFCFNVHVQGLWLIADGFVTLMFMLDVFMNFRTGFVQKGKRELKDGLRIVRPAVIVMDPKAIARRYLRTSFAIDFISSVPWDFLLFVPSVKKRYWVLQILRSLKILRIHRLRLVRSELRETWSAGQREFLEICGLFGLTLYFSHLCACLFVAVGKLQNDPQRWIDQTNYDDQGTAAPLTDGPAIDLYIASLYFQMVSLSTVGYGDIHAGITIPDRAFMTVTDLFGALLMAYIVGKISTLIILKRNRRYALRERFATLHAYIAREELPEWLTTRLMVHLSRQWSSQIIEFSEVELVKDMTDELRSELLIHWWRRSIPSSALLPHKHGFLAMLLAKCKNQVFPANDVITKEGETVRQLWILRAGQLAVSRSVAMDDLDVIRGGVSDDDVSSGEEEAPDAKDADAIQLKKLTGYRRPDQRSLHRLPTSDWAVDLDRGDQSDKALVTEMAAPGTIIGEAPLLLALSQKVLKDRAARQAGGKEKKKLAVKAIVQDVTVRCKIECSVLVLLLDDFFEIMDQFPSLAQKLKRAIIRAERHIRRSKTAGRL